MKRLIDISKSDDKGRPAIAHRTHDNERSNQNGMWLVTSGNIFRRAFFACKMNRPLTLIHDARRDAFTFDSGDR
jgi:hypothetical protein